jgi:hypothetical protein
MAAPGGKQRVIKAISPPVWKKPIRAAGEKYFTYDRLVNGKAESIVEVVRKDDGKGNKTIYQRYKVGGKGVYKIPPAIKPEIRLYQIFHPVNKAAQGKQIFLVEGEGVVDALLAADIPATTIFGGPNGWGKYGYLNYLEDLKGYQVVLCPDGDTVGLKHCERIEADLKAHGVEIAGWCYAFPKNSLWQRLPKSGGADLADWIDDGATRDQILAAVEAKRLLTTVVSTKDRSVGLSTAELVARIQTYDELENPIDKWEAWEAIKADSDKAHRDLMELVRAIKVRSNESDRDWAISAKEFGSLDLGSKEWLFTGLLPANRSILIGADAKTGKSLLVYDWAFHLATGQSWGEFYCDRPRKVLIVQTDESEIDCQERINARGLNELENVRIIRSFTPALMARLKRVATDWGAEVIIFDSLTSIQRHSGYSPKDPEYGYWLYDLKDFASECRITPILITHTNKAPIDLGLDKVAGSYSITAAVSEIFMVTRPAKPDDECDRVLVRVGSRSAGQSAWLIGLNLEDFSWEYKFPCQRDGKPLEDDDSFTPNQKLNCRENIIKFFAHHNGKEFDAKEISEILGANYHNVRKLCAELKSEGIISRRRVGKA